MVLTDISKQDLLSRQPTDPKMHRLYIHRWEVSTGTAVVAWPCRTVLRDLRLPRGNLRRHVLHGRRRLSRPGTPPIGSGLCACDELEPHGY
jgi:hypothetical protein